MNNQKGFTLIELLVAIAIIGILSTLVITSLSSAKNRAANRKIQAAISDIRKVAALFADDNGGYGNSCMGSGTNCTSGGVNCLAVSNTSPTNNNLFYGTAVKSVIEQAALASGGSVTGTGANAYLTRTSCKKATGPDGAWAVAVTNVDGTSAYCVDSSGASKTIPASTSIVITATNPAAVINNSTFQCR